MTSFGVPPSMVNYTWKPSRLVRLAPIEAIIAEVGGEFQMTRAALFGRAQSKAFVAGRRRLVRRLIDELGMSFSDIGRLIDRNHATIINLYRPKRQKWRPR